MTDEPHAPLRHGCGIHRKPPLDAKERPLLLDIIEDRHGRKSIIITSQLPVTNWYDAIGEQTVADAILDRIAHSAHCIELTGESVSKIKATAK